MDKLVETLGITSLSKSQVSVMAKELDTAVEAFRSRPLDAGPYTFVAADALVLKVRECGRVVNVHALIAVGVNAEGYLEILGIDVSTAVNLIELYPPPAGADDATLQTRLPARRSPRPAAATTTTTAGRRHRLGVGPDRRRQRRVETVEIWPAGADGQPVSVHLGVRYQSGQGAGISIADSYFFAHSGATPAATANGIYAV